MKNVIATFCLSSDVPSPKVKGVKSGCSPHHKFCNIDYLVSGQHEYGDDEIHYPGESITTAITFASWEHINKEIKTGDEFEVRE